MVKPRLVVVTPEMVQPPLELVRKAHSLEYELRITSAKLQNAIDNRDLLLIKLHMTSSKRLCGELEEVVKQLEAYI